MQDTFEVKLSQEELELISSCIIGQISVVNQLPVMTDEKLSEAAKDLRRRLAELNSKICDML